MIDNSILYIKELDKFSSKYLKHTKPLGHYAFKNHEYLKNHISELLLLYDRLSFKVYGENVPLALLISWYGGENVLNLLKSNSIEFILHDKALTYIKSDIKHVIPIQSLELTTEHNTKPKISAKQGFKWISKNSKPSAKIRKKILHKATTNTITLPKLPDIGDIYNFYCKNYNKPKDGLFSTDQKIQMLNIANQTLEISLASKNDYNFWDSENTWEILNKRTESYSQANLIHKKTNNIMELNSLPNIAQLIGKRHIPLEDIVELRNQENTKKFREWIKTTSDKDDYKTASKEYLESLRPKYSFTGNKWFKSMKLASISVTSGLIGNYVQGNVGGIGGVLLGMGLDYLLNSFDSNIIESYLNGWSPQNFINDTIKPYYKSNNI